MTSGSNQSIAESKMKHSTSQRQHFALYSQRISSETRYHPCDTSTNTDKQQKHFLERLQLGHICHLSLGSYLSSQSSWQTDSAIIAACLQNTEYTWVDPWYTHTTAAAHTKTHTQYVYPLPSARTKRGQWKEGLFQRKRSLAVADKASPKYGPRLGAERRAVIQL